MRREVRLRSSLARRVSSGRPVTATCSVWKLRTCSAGLRCYRPCLLEPIVRRTIALMVRNGEVDERLAGSSWRMDNLQVYHYWSPGSQPGRRSDQAHADGRDGQNLPRSHQHFRWDQYGIALISCLVSIPTGYVMNRKPTRGAEQQQKAMEMQQQQPVAMGAAQGAGAAAGRSCSDRYYQCGHADDAGPDWNYVMLERLLQIQNAIVGALEAVIRGVVVLLISGKENNYV